MLVDASFLPCYEDVDCLSSPLSGAKTHSRSNLRSFLNEANECHQPARLAHLFFMTTPDLPALICSVLAPTFSLAVLVTPMLTSTHDFIVVLASRDMMAFPLYTFLSTLLLERPSPLSLLSFASYQRSPCQHSHSPASFFSCLPLNRQEAFAVWTEPHMPCIDYIHHFQ